MNVPKPFRSQAADPAQGVGARLARKEDDRLMRGRGQFVGDIRLPGMQDVAFVRSPLAHATIRGITIPAPYPDGITPSNWPYSIGCSSTCIASRLTFGSSAGPFGMAHESSTPLCSRRKS